MLNVAHSIENIMQPKSNPVVKPPPYEGLAVITILRITYTEKPGLLKSRRGSRLEAGAQTASIIFTNRKRRRQLKN